MYQLHLRRGLVAAALVGLLVPVMPVSAQTPQTQPDNTKVNTRDRAKGAVTADQQKENTSDREIARKIRRSLMDDKGLSTYAHNVKIVAQDGQVTLKGPVRTAGEKKTIEGKATEIAGTGHVTNQISVVPAKHAKK
jgi:hyperosmotically inducible protein